METYNCYYCDNILDYPNQIGLLYLGFPRCFVRFENNCESYFTDYDFWRENIATIDWLEPKESSNYTESEKEEVLQILWNFLCLQEEEEDRLFEENNGYEIDDDF